MIQQKCQIQLQDVIPSKYLGSVVGGLRIKSRKGGSLKQLRPISSNLWHLATVRFAKAKANCFETLLIPAL